MKLHISVDDLNELTEEQKEKLRGMWNYEKYQQVYDEMYEKIITIRDKNYYDLYKHRLLPLLNIGQMIEILHISYKGRYLLYDIFKGLVGIDGRAFKEVGKGGEWEEGIELCDALWQAVKNIL